MNKCECPIKASVVMKDEGMYSEEEKGGMNHAPGKCKGTNDIKLYKRGDKELNLCSRCFFLGDEALA